MSRAGAFRPVARLKRCLLPRQRAKGGSHRRDGTNRQKGPRRFAFVALSGLGQLKVHHGGARERDGRVSLVSERRESLSLRISRSFTSLGGFISLLCNSARRLPSCSAVIYNSAPSEFAEIPKATAQIR